MAILANTSMAPHPTRSSPAFIVSARSPPKMPGDLPRGQHWRLPNASSRASTDNDRGRQPTQEGRHIANTVWILTC